MHQWCSQGGFVRIGSIRWFWIKDPTSQPLTMTLYWGWIHVVGKKGTVRGDYVRIGQGDAGVKYYPT